MNQFALITGASSGIGLALTEIFARDHINLVLVARSGDTLRNIAIELKQKYNIEVHIIEKDLSKETAAQEVFEYTQSYNIHIEYLVNNAGFGDYGDFIESDIEKNSRMISLNIGTLTRLSRLYSEQMKNNKSGKILNVASTAAFQPGPYMAVYFATKSYVLSFSLALSAELKEHGITITTLCPGATASNFQSNADAGWVSIFAGKLPTSEIVALFGYKKMNQWKKVAIHGIMNTIKAVSVKFLPIEIQLLMMQYIMKK
jgi:short-subunit dehydrogenase